jgi:hypothetical protein
MSGTTAGGGGDLLGNLFGGNKQVYPAAPPGYKYVDLSIPQAPPGYTLAKMSMIANNQSTPTALGGNAGLLETKRGSTERASVPASPVPGPAAAAPPASPPAGTTYPATSGSTTNQPLPGLPGSDAPPSSTVPTPKNLKTSFMPQALASFWQNMTSGPTPAFDPQYATIEDQRYDPLT